MEELMSLRLMFSGTYTNLFDARFCSFSLSFHFHIVILLSFTLQFSAAQICRRKQSHSTLLIPKTSLSFSASSTTVNFSVYYYECFVFFFSLCWKLHGYCSSFSFVQNSSLVNLVITLIIYSFSMILG